MDNKFYTVDEIAAMLDMHKKTVQRYMREGKIRGTKIGKAWRVSESDLNAFLGNMKLTDAKRGKSPKTGEKTAISSVVDIDVANSDEAINIANSITAAMNSKPDIYGKTSLNIQFLESENKLRIMVWGGIKFMEDFLFFLKQYN